MILAVGERLRGRNGYGIACVHTHRVEIFDRADDDNVVLKITHDLQFELLPSDNRLLDENCMNRTQIKTALEDAFKFFAIEGNTTAGPAQSERGTDNGGKANILYNPHCFADISHHAASGSREPDIRHGLFEKQPVFGHFHGFGFRPDHLDVVLIEDSSLGKFDCNIERGLPADGRQQSIRSFAFDDRRDEFGGQRFDVRTICQFRIGHDRCGIRIDENDLVPLLSQRLASLRPRIVEFASLADHDGTGTDDEDLSDVSPLWHSSSAQKTF